MPRLKIEEAKRGGLRWAVGSENGPRSSTWRLWGNKKGDIYMSVRNLGGILKTSFHKDGNCHTGLTSTYISKQNTDNQSRHWDKWKLPEEPVLRVMQIVVPSSELSVFESNDAKQMTWLPPPAQNSVSVVSVFIAQHKTLKTWPEAEHGARPVGLIHTELRTAWVVYSENPIDEFMISEIEKYRLKIAEIPGASEAPKKPGIRAILWGLGQKKHDRFFIELAWD